MDRNRHHISVFYWRPLALVILLMTMAGCIRVVHLGDNTGKAFHRTNARQTRGDVRHKPMEAELASRAAKKMTKPAGQSHGNSRGLAIPIPVVTN